MLHEATFRIRTDRARAIYRALLPELSDEVSLRSRTTCVLEREDLLTLVITANDLSALRAALNMTLRLVSVADEVQDLVSKGAVTSCLSVI